MFHFLFIVLLFNLGVYCEEGLGDEFCSSIGGFQVNDKCFRLMHESRVMNGGNWLPAREVCKEFHPTSLLGIITSHDEQEKIVERLIEENITGKKFWLGFMPHRFQGNDISDFVLRGIDSTVYEYSNWSEDILEAEIEKSSLDHDTCHMGTYLSNTLCVVLSTKEEKFGKWVTQKCNRGSYMYSFCEVDLSKPELLLPGIEKNYSPVEITNEDEGEEKIDEDRHIFQIGFNRCGTSSLSFFFEGNNISSCHHEFGRLAATMYKNYLENNLLLEGISDECVFMSDMEYFPHIQAYRRFFKLLDRQYPNARFMLNIRDKNTWLRSRSLHVGGLYVNATSRYHNWSYEETIDFWSDHFDEHHNDVVEYFEGRPGKLLVYDIEKDSPSKLVDFFKDWYPEMEVGEYWGKINSLEEQIEGKLFFEEREREREKKRLEKRLKEIRKREKEEKKRKKMMKNEMRKREEEERGEEL